MPIFVFDDAEEWFNKKYGKGFKDMIRDVGFPRIVAALESFRLNGERSSLNDPVGCAHNFAERYRLLNKEHHE